MSHQSREKQAVCSGPLDFQKVERKTQRPPFHPLRVLCCPCEPRALVQSARLGTGGCRDGGQSRDAETPAQTGPDPAHTGETRIGSQLGFHLLDNWCCFEKQRGKQPHHCLRSLGFNFGSLRQWGQTAEIPTSLGCWDLQLTREGCPLSHTACRLKTSSPVLPLVTMLSHRVLGAFVFHPVLRQPHAATEVRSLVSSEAISE